MIIRCAVIQWLFAALLFTHYVRVIGRGVELFNDTTEYPLNINRITTELQSNYNSITIEQI